MRIIALCSALLAFAAAHAQLSPCNVSLSVALPSCPGDNNGVITVVNGGGGPYTYAWDHSATELDAVAAGLAPGIYQVIITGDTCESILDTVMTDPYVAPLGNVTAVNTSCAGINDGSITLSLNSANYTWFWNHAPANQSFTLTGMSPGWYVATINAGVGCLSLVGATVGDPAITITGETEYCASDPPVVTAELEFSFSPDVYVWSTGDSTQSFTIIPPFSGQIDLTATDTTSGCVVTAQFNITELPSPTVVFATPDSTCQGVSTLVQTIASTADSLVWRWGIGNYGFSNQTDPTILFTDYGWQPVSLQGFDSLGCGNAAVLDSIYANYQVPAIFTALHVPCTPTVDITLGSSTDSCAFFINDVLWTNDCGGFFNYDNRRYEELTFTLYATQPNGCNDTLTTTVDVRTEPVLFLANAFTPNEDGINDLWPMRVEISDYGFELLLFDRWGELIWETKKPTDQWDGIVDGDQAPTGVYVYTMRMRDPCEGTNQIERTGHVTLFR